MADVPVFGADQIDPLSAQGGGAPASLGTLPFGTQTTPGSYSPNNYWRDALFGRFGQSPGTVGYQTGNQDQARLEQQRVIQALQAQAAGDPNSLAQRQLANSYGQAQSQQSSLGSTMRGQSAGAAQRGIQQGQQQIQRALPGDQQMLMLQEQQAAQAMLAQLLAQQQGQDISQAQGMANTSLGNSAVGDAAKQFYLGLAGDMDLTSTERSNQLARAQMGFMDEQNALTQGLIRRGVNALGTGAGVVGSWGGGAPSQDATHNSTPSRHYGEGGSH